MFGAGLGLLDLLPELVERVVESSLRMLKDEHAEKLFMQLGLCPEDVPIPIAVVQLICKSAGGSSGSALAIRRSVKKLLDRSLL